MNQINLGIEKCINSLGEKFLKWPYNFFTESDAHSFLYYYIFRSGPKELKLFYSTINDDEKTVLIHREYPTNFRYHKENMSLDEETGGRGHYDLVILNPDFIKDHNIKEVIAQDYKKTCQKNIKEHLLAAIEFKLITKPLSAGLKNEIEKDFKKLAWAVKDKEQAKNAYLIIFNRTRKEEVFLNDLRKYSAENPEVKAIYIESIKNEKRTYKILYMGSWSHKLKYGLTN
ncbi:MAG: hypothetical protein ACD_79C01283G0004 [uncultured bacterium]|nr:MAG: hypothetical protein ACD_79C01283G0004 [uncultured bacterium]